MAWKEISSPSSRVSFLFAWKDGSTVRLVDFSGLSLLSSVLTFAIISSACSPFCTSYFHVRHSTTPIWARSVVCRLWRQVSISVDCAMSLGHRSAILWNLSTNILDCSPFFCFMARRARMVIFVSSSKKWVRKSFSKLAQFLMEPSRSFMDHSKATPLRVPMNKWAKIVSFDTTFPV